MFSYKFFLVFILFTLLNLSRQSDLLSTESETSSTSTIITTSTPSTIPPSKIIYLGYQKTSEDLQFYEGGDNSGEDYIYSLQQNENAMKLSISLNYFYCHVLNKRPSFEITTIDALTGIEFKTTWECRNIAGDATIKNARSVTIKLDNDDWNPTLFAASITITAYQEKEAMDMCSGKFSFNCNGHLDQNDTETNHCIDNGLKCNGRRNCGRYDYDENHTSCQKPTTTKITTTTAKYEKKDTGIPVVAWILIFAIPILLLVAIVMFACCCCGLTVNVFLHCCCKLKAKPETSIGETVISNGTLSGNQNTMTNQKIQMVPKLATNDELPSYTEIMETSKYPG